MINRMHGLDIFQLHVCNIGMCSEFMNLGTVLFTISFKDVMLQIFGEITNDSITDSVAEMSFELLGSGPPVCNVEIAVDLR